MSAPKASHCIVRTFTRMGNVLWLPLCDTKNTSPRVAPDFVTCRACLRAIKRNAAPERKADP